MGRTSHKLKIKFIAGILILALALPAGVAFVHSDGVMAAGLKTYTISPGMKPYEGIKPYTREDLYGYNSKTKHYLLLRSYLERLEKEGGGTLVLKKGTYGISNCLYVPSNVTIRFKDGVKLVKLANGSALGMFQLVSAKTAYRHGKVKYGGYQGEKNIKLIGEGTVIFDQMFIQNAHSLILCHNENVTISGITFQNMYGSHFIEMDASKNVLIENCTFQNFKRTARANEEAINIDTPDKTTDAMHAEWSSFDKTPCRDITIRKNLFQDLEKAVGTHKYSEDRAHKNITITENVIRRMHHDAVVCMNYADCIVTDNQISNTIRDNPGKNIGYKGIALAGVSNPTVTGNRMENIPVPIEAYKWKNTGDGSQYAAIELRLSDADKIALRRNTAVNCGEAGVWVYPELKTESFISRYFLPFDLK